MVYIAYAYVLAQGKVYFRGKIIKKKKKWKFAVFVTLIRLEHL